LVCIGLRSLASVVVDAPLGTSTLFAIFTFRFRRFFLAFLSDSGSDSEDEEDDEDDEDDEEEVELPDSLLLSCLFSALAGGTPAIWSSSSPQLAITT